MTASSAWEEIADSLAGAASIFDRDDVELDDLDRAEGLRFLLRLTRLAARALEPRPSPHAPSFTTFGPPDVTFGIPNPDNLYQSAPIDGTCTYRIRGRRNSVHYVSFGVQAPGIAATPGSRSHLDARDLECASDGTFEIVLAADEQKGNWLRLAPESRSLMVRQTFLDRTREVAADLDIECCDPPPRPAGTALSLDHAQTATSGIGAQVKALAEMWVDFVAGFPSAVNEFFINDLETHLAIGGDPEVRTPLMRWRIDDGKMLAVDLVPPPCEYWNIQLANIWTEPLDARAGVSCRNAADAVETSPGTFRMVIANEDPGVPNWLDAGGHRNGTASVRWARAKAWPLPDTELLHVR